MTDTRDSLQSVINDMRERATMAIPPLSQQVGAPLILHWADRLTALQAGAGDGAAILAQERANDECIARYTALIYAVESKFPNESRFETALRYIREREKRIKRN